MLLSFYQYNGVQYTSMRCYSHETQRRQSRSVAHCEFEPIPKEYSYFVT